ncbi:MAG: hypothetical protein C4326_12100 [Ignavibacteria bacterium]
MLHPTNLTAALLAGGKSSRMGTDQALLTINGATLIGRIADVLKRVFDRVIVIADRGERYAFLQFPCYPDIVHDAGPLAGIHSALAHSATGHVFIVSCDTPFVSEAMIREVLARAHKHAVTIVSDGMRTHSLFGVYPTALRTEIEQSLLVGKRSVSGWLEARGMEVLDFSRFAARLENINTPEEWEKAKSRRSDE